MSKKEKKFDMGRDFILPRWYLKPIQWIGAFFLAGPFATRSKIVKHNFKSFKEPAIIISNHASMVDFANLTKAMFPYMPCYITSIDEYIGREWLMRHIGCLPKRKFTTDLSMIKKIVNTVQNKNHSVCLYAEARFTLCGVNERIGDALGKLAKLAKVRVIVMNQKGNFLRSPVWNKHPYRCVKNICDFYEVASKEEVLSLTPQEIQDRIDKAFVYDDYKWQRDEKIKIKSKKRAHNIHNVLYKCPNCEKEGFMTSFNSTIKCNACNSTWNMDEYGLLHCENQETKFELVSDWYRWEREKAYEEVFNFNYHFEDDVRLEKLVNAQVGFKKVGIVRFTQNDEGITLKGTLDDGSEFYLNKPALSTSSLHIEFNYKKKGNAMDINTIDDTWFAYPLNHPECLTKFNFTTEALFDKHKKNKT